MWEGGVGANTKAVNVMLLVGGVAMAEHEQVGKASGGEHAIELVCFIQQRARVGLRYPSDGSIQSSLWSKLTFAFNGWWKFYL